MSPSICEWPWTDYIFHPFPVISSSKYTPQVGHIEPTHTLHLDDTRHHSVPWRQLLSAAIVKLISLYVDAPEFVFAEICEEQPISAFKANTAAIQQDSITWADLASSLNDLRRHRVSVSCARAALKLADTTNPYPVVVVWDPRTPELVDVDDSAVVVKINTQNEKNGDVVVGVGWNCSALSPDAAQILLKQILSLFNIAAADPSRTASTLGLDRTLTSVIQANFDPEEACCATDWLVRSAIERPDAISHEIYSNLSSPPRLLTYSELNTMANKLAHWLRSSGLKSEDRVALCRSRDLQFYVAQAGIFKSGGCYVPVRAYILYGCRVISASYITQIDPELPEERKRHIAENSDAKFILTGDAWFKSFKGPIYSLDSPETLEEVDSQDSSEISLAKLDSSAYLIYTSGQCPPVPGPRSQSFLTVTAGTTGKPKGCLLNHRGLYWAIKAFCEHPQEVTNPDTDKRLAMACTCVPSLPRVRS